MTVLEVWVTVDRTTWDGRADRPEARTETEPDEGTGLRTARDKGAQTDAATGGELRAGTGNAVAVDLGFEATDLESLLRYRMPFGRYSGRPLIDLPEEYLLWFEREEFPAGELGRLLKLTLGIKRYGAEGVVKGLRGPRGTRDLDG